MLKFQQILGGFLCQTAPNLAKFLNINFLIKISICISAEILLSLYIILPKYLSSCHDIIMKIHTDGHR